MLLHVHGVEEGEMRVCRSRGVVVRKGTIEELSEEAAIRPVLGVILAVLVSPGGKVESWGWK